MSGMADLNTDILIIGAGPTGLLLANLLGNMGVRTLLVERLDDTEREPRAVSLDDESMRMLQSVGLAEEVANICVHGYGSLYRGPTGKVFATVKPFVKEFGFDKRNAFEQPFFVDILRRAAEQLPSVDLRFGTDLVDFQQTPDEVTANVRSSSHGDQRVRAKYMVACDGGRSSVRKALDIKMSGSTFEEPWLIIDLPSTLNRCFHTEVFCDPERSCITLPGPGGIRRYEFKLNKGETIEEAETEAFARKLLASVGPDGDQDLRRVQVYTFHARMAETWRQDRVFLAGDAAHLTPPFAGQGMNSGLRDAANLGWKLDEAMRSDDPEPLLSSYESERKPHAWSMIKLAMRMGQVMMPSSKLQGRLIRLGFEALKLHKPSRDYFAQMKYKPRPRFTDGLIWKDGRPAKATVVGQMLPQPMVMTVDHVSCLLDSQLDDRPFIFVYDERPDKVITFEDVAKFADRGIGVIGITPEAVNPIRASFPIVRDQSRFLSGEPFVSYLGHAILVRRDRYIAATAPVTQVGDLTEPLKYLTNFHTMSEPQWTEGSGAAKAG